MVLVEGSHSLPDVWRVLVDPTDAGAPKSPSGSLLPSLNSKLHINYTVSNRLFITCEDVMSFYNVNSELSWKFSNWQWQNIFPFFCIFWSIPRFWKISVLSAVKDINVIGKQTLLGAGLALGELEGWLFASDTLSASSNVPIWVTFPSCWAEKLRFDKEKHSRWCWKLPLRRT